MRFKTSLLFCVGLTALSIAACSDSQHPPPAVRSLDTAQVLLLAQSPSETSMPFQVDNGRVTLSDTSETAVPIAVNGP